MDFRTGGRIKAGIVSLLPVRNILNSFIHVDIVYSCINTIRFHGTDIDFYLGFHDKNVHDVGFYKSMDIFDVVVDTW